MSQSRQQAARTPPACCVSSQVLGHLALEACLSLPGVATVLDIGSGDGLHAQAFRSAGKQVTTVSMREPADLIGDYLTLEFREPVELIWASHVLEHQRNPGAFLEKCRRDLKRDGWLAVTVPPMKGEVVGGHVSLFNAGILLYHLILAGFDCRHAAVRTYGYNISVIVQNRPAELPPLECDHGDIERLARWFPLPVRQGFDGHIDELNWPPRVEGGTVIDFPSAGVTEPRPQWQSAAPEHVVILGLGPSLEAYVDLVKRLGSRRSFADEVWGINAVGDVVQCDRIFHMDDVLVQEARAAARPRSNIANMLAWLREHPGPIYTSIASADGRDRTAYPGLIEFPLADVINSGGYAYFNSTAAYAVAFAVHLGVKKISLFGCDFTYAKSHDAEKGRGCMEFWLGIAAERGIDLGIAERSSLMDMCEPEDLRIYGYDAVKVQITEQADGPSRVTFIPRELLPTADEIEARYDHSKHPNSLVKK